MQLQYTLTYNINVGDYPNKVFYSNAMYLLKVHAWLFAFISLCGIIVAGSQLKLNFTDVTMTRCE